MKIKEPVLALIKDWDKKCKATNRGFNAKKVNGPKCMQLLRDQNAAFGKMMNALKTLI